MLRGKMSRGKTSRGKMSWGKMSWDKMSLYLWWAARNKVITNYKRTGMRTGAQTGLCTGPWIGMWTRSSFLDTAGFTYNNKPVLNQSRRFSTSLSIRVVLF